MRRALDLQSGTELIGRFVVESRIGIGGMGEVYLLFDRVSDRKLVAKFPILDKKLIEEQREVFEREFKLLLELKHPKIVEVFEYLNLENGHPFFTMEYLQGVTLKEFIKTRSEPATSRESSLEILKILEDIAEALSHIHSFGVLHHDLKPDNVFVVRSSDSNLPVAKLLDFGLVLNRGSHTEQEAGYGSLFYKSPEQYREKKLDITSEVYAFGSLAFELFTGERPFDLKEGHMVIEFVLERIIGRKHCVGHVRQIKDTHPKIREMVNRTVQICMEKDVALRYQTMEQVLWRVQEIRKQLETPSLFERIKGSGGATPSRG